MIDRLVYYLADQGPTIVRRLSSQGSGTLDIVAGMSFKLKVRPRFGGNLLINATMTPDVTADTVTYQPQPTDFVEEGAFRAWIELTISGAVQSTDEFDLDVLAHGPGQGVRTGAVARAARALVPIAWDSVRGVKGFGDIELQRQIDLAKLRVLRVATTVVQEDALDPRVVDYLAKKVLVDSVLSAVIDFWTNQTVTRVAHANSQEVETYPDRIRAAEKQLDRFRAELEDLKEEVELIIGKPTGVLTLAPALDSYDDLVTPGLEDFPRPTFNNGFIFDEVSWP